MCYFKCIAYKFIYASSSSAAVQPATDGYVRETCLEDFRNMHITFREMNRTNCLFLDLTSFSFCLAHARMYFEMGCAIQSFVLCFGAGLKFGRNALKI